MVNELDRFESLLNDLLEISRHDAGGPNVRGVRSRATVSSALGNVGHLADDAGVELLVDMPADDVIAEIDAAGWNVCNLTPMRSTMPNTNRAHPDGRRRGHRRRHRPRLRGGPQTGEEKLVFSRFWRSDRRASGRSGGTGLGLAISIEDARLHQGRLGRAWGEPGKGACSRLTCRWCVDTKVTTSPLPAQTHGA